jgi:PAS domain S-box-containing protein
VRGSIPSQWLILGIALLILGGAGALNLYLEHERTAHRERDRLLTQAKVIQLNGGKNLIAVDRVLAELAKKAPPRGIDAELNRHLDMLVDAMPSMRTLLVVDAGGIVRASNRDELLGITVGHRAYFQQPLRGQDADVFYVSPPFRTVLGTFTINVTRVVRGPRGEFAGVVSTALDPAYFRPLLDSVRYAQDMWAAIAHGDGDILMMVPERPGISGTNVARPGTSFSRHRASGKTETFHDGIGFITGDERLLVWGNIEPAGLKMSAPLAIGMARSRDEVFAAWRRDVLIQGGVFALIALASVAGLYVYQRRQREFERRMAKDADALAQSAERLKLATAAAGVGVWDYDLATDRLTWDDSMFAIYGTERVAFSSTYDAWRETVLPEDLPHVEAGFIAAMERSLPFEAEFRIRRGDGAVRDIRALGRPRHDRAGKPLRMVGTNEDITERKAAEVSLEAARRAAEEANLAKSRFLATMSHEIRTPLNGILGMAQLLITSEPSAAERRQYVRTILESGKLLLTLLNDILDLSKVEAGKFQLIDAVFAPGQLLDEVDTLFSEIAGHKGLSLEVEWRGAASRRYRGDPIRLRQMLSNFVANALKFTSSGGIRIAAEEVGTEDGKALLRFAVSDTGIGIPVEKQHLLFKPFSQIDASNTREFGGTGLGLSIVSSLAKLMGGEVGVDSGGANQGATFWFHVRATPVAEGEECRAEDRGAAAAPPAAAIKAGRARILVVEDVATNRVVLEAMLKKLGHEFVTVADGQAALEAVTRGDAFGLVLMDCQMPVMDGFEATQGIRAWEAESGKTRLPIVALTAGAFHEDHDRCIAAGMDGYLAKPVDLKKLAAAVDKWLSRPAA